MIRSLTMGAALLAVLFASPLAAQEPPRPTPQGQDPPRPAPQQDPREVLRESMQARYPLLARLRDAGKIGETGGGEVALVKDVRGTERADPKDPKAGTLADVVAAENKDRLALYALLAKELKVTPAEVARQNALRNVQKAEPDHWLLVKGQWVQKKNVEPRRDGDGDGGR